MHTDYKDTLNLPRTDFPMKANLGQKEPEMLKFWEHASIYRKLLEQNRSSNSYILHDGPPYANGNIHIGHALNKILKDIIVKYKAMRGFYAPYVPGWDCHGLPIELQVDKKLGEKKGTVGVPGKRALCREYAEHYLSVQREEFKRLGIFGDWDDPYLTMSYGYEASIIREFFRFFRSGAVYKGKKPVHWCSSCVTALAEAEVEYADKQSPSIFVRFPVTDEGVKQLLPGTEGFSVFIIIWTTTPWTLPANLALAVHPDLDYAAVKTVDAVYLVAEANLPALGEKIGISGDVILTMKGSALEGIRTRHPFIDRESPVIPGNFVEVGEGSGIVHIAPGHGIDDYEAGLRHGFDIYAPVDDRGKFTADVPAFQGQFVFTANEAIIETLRLSGALLGMETFTHSYPHCWRCKKPVIFRATSQWFISMEKGDLRTQCLSEIRKTAWIPFWGQDRISGMVENRPDWCISRQRAWGVPITLITCEQCGKVVDGEAYFDLIIRMTEENGADFWFTADIAELLDGRTTCTLCGGPLIKEMDILDVWFDSGTSHAAVLERDHRLSWPADMYLEGSDQHRGWFQSSLLASVGTRGKAPYRTVLTHGFTVDGQGKKMSKSLGNVIAPQEIIKSNGAEIVRLWVSAEDYRDDIRLSREILNRLTDAYRKIRNTARFLLGNLSDFREADHREHLLEIDRWAMSRLQRLIGRVTAAYDSFAFHEAFHAVYSFCVTDLSSFYIDILKDRIYTFRADSDERRAGQWVYYRILKDMTRLVAPILSFTAEEIWGYLREISAANQGETLTESVFLTGFPEVDESWIDEELEKTWDKLILVRNDVNKALEIRRQDKFIGNSLEAQVVLYANDEMRAFLASHQDFLPALFIVSSVVVLPSPEPETGREGAEPALSVVVEKAPGNKCERCWVWSPTVGHFPSHPTVCGKCFTALL